MNHVLTQPPASKTTRRGGNRSSRLRARVLAAVVAGASVAAGAAGYAITAAKSPAARPPAANHQASSRLHPGGAAQQAALAAKILRAAATHVAGAGVTSEPSPGQWIYNTTVSYGHGGVSTDEEWITFDGGGTAYFQNGQLITHTSDANPPGPNVKPWDAWNTTATPKTAYDVLASLPAEPRALLAVIARHAGGQHIGAGNPVAGVEPTTEAQREFDVLTLILWNAVPGIGGPPAAEAAAYRALATLPGITVQQGIKDTAGGRAIGVSDDGGYDQLLIDPVSYRVIGIRQLSTGITPPSLAQQLASGHMPAELRQLLAGMTKAQRAGFIAMAQKMREAAVPPKGTLLEEIVYAKTAEVPAPGSR
jgi:hypothetical protein